MPSTHNVDREEPQRLEACLAKGFEFDRTLVTDTGDSHYQIETNRRLLYVACCQCCIS